MAASLAKVKEMKERRGGGGESLVLKCLPLGLLSDERRGFRRLGTHPSGWLTK